MKTRIKRLWIAFSGICVVHVLCLIATDALRDFSIDPNRQATRLQEIGENSRDEVGRSGREEF